jgi:hypothetical protein
LSTDVLGGRPFSVKVFFGLHLSFGLDEGQQDVLAGGVPRNAGDPFGSVVDPEWNFSHARKNGIWKRKKRKMRCYQNEIAHEQKCNISLQRNRAADQMQKIFSQKRNAAKTFSNIQKVRFYC